MFYNLPGEKREKFLQALHTLTDVYPDGQVYAQDMLIAIWKNLAFRSDQKFMSSFESVVKNDQERSLLWRLHVLAWGALNALYTEGDFVECGVLRGFSSAVICKFLDFETIPRTFYLYDTFTGLSAETSTEEERRNWDYSDIDGGELYEEVCRKFSPYPNVKVIKGIVPASFTSGVPEKIAYLHIDMNSEKAEIMALDQLFDRVAAGGVIILDDYGWQCNVRQTIAESAFMREHNHAILELPTGQGVILKH